MLSGITMGPGSNSSWQNEAVALGADTAYPYEGQNGWDSVMSVKDQGSGVVNNATYAARDAIAYAIAGNGGKPVDIIAYSGGAGAFAAAYSLLTSWQQSMIGKILYIDPGANGSVPVNSQTTVEWGKGRDHWLATARTSVPSGTPSISTGCAHTDLGCLFGGASAQLSAIQADGQCSDPEVYTRSSPWGMPGTGIPSPPPPPVNPVAGGFWWYLSPPVDDPNQCWVSGCSAFASGNQ